MDKLERRSFLKKLGLTTTGFFSTPFLIGSFKKNRNYKTLDPGQKDKSTYSQNDQIQLALIGAGKMGQGNTQVALEHSGVKLAAVCDLYESRLNRCQELFGNDIDTTMDYREVLDRDDVDAVIIATPDHWHNTIAIDALNSDKAIYLEKPMVQHIEEGYGIIEAAEGGPPVIVGSTSTSDIVYRKARDLYKNGEIGELNLVESYYDRYSAMGAWQYSIPPSASTDNVAWDTFLKDLPDRPFDPKRFFRWRNYQDYGTGVAGDLFVHLFSGIHLVTGSNGPNRIMSTGGLRFWDDGRNVPDIMTGMYDYPETDSHPAFNLTLRVNFADGSGGGRLIRFVGSEGEIIIDGDEVTLRKAKLPEAPGMSINEFGKEVREEYREFYNNKYGNIRPSSVEADPITYRSPDGYSSRYDHFKNFFGAIRNDSDILQDATFGLRAAAPALASNLSYFQNEIIEWDPDEMRLL
ncbi:MAG: Gfo/Idh/MocA family oxidoreductase [Balneolaceae bacterium]|nr:Gfo/Idh/MocA family oxidoreductase [Balneolaceae bacterium]